MFKTTLMIALTSATLLNSDLRLSETGNTIQAYSRGPAGISVTASTYTMRDESNETSWKFVSPLSSFKTGLSLRDDHMAQALDVTKFPEVSVSIPLDRVKRPEADEDVEGRALGTLAFHGVERSVEVKYFAAGDCEGNVIVRASFDFNLTDFGVKPPGYLGINLKPNISVIANVRLNSASSL